jgi:MFS family permease
MFAYLGVALFAGQMIGSPITSAVMNYNPWLSIFLGIAIVVICGLIVLTLPETLNIRISEDIPSDLATESEFSQTKATWLQRVKENVTKLGQAELWHIWRKNSVALLLFTFVVTNLGKILQELILQYSTNRYQWTWARVSLISINPAKISMD